MNALFSALKRVSYTTVTFNYSRLAYVKLLIELSLTCFSTLLD